MGQYSSSDRAMREYLTALLEDEQREDDQAQPLEALTRAPLERLLAQPAQVAQEEEIVVTTAPEPLLEKTLEKQSTADSADLATAELTIATNAEQQDSTPPPTGFAGAMQSYQEEPFQALFFSVAGLTLAVPLKSLGGIHKWQMPKPLFGQPAWYLGIMPHREEQLNVVDSARWVMPEKYTRELANSLDYQYLVMLGESHWGLACEALVNTNIVHPDEVQWRTSEGKRPWLAGIVKDKMCALLNVEAFIALIEQGLDNSRTDE